MDDSPYSSECRRMGDDECNNVFDADDDDEELESYEEGVDPDADPDDPNTEAAYLSDREEQQEDEVEEEHEDDGVPDAGIEPRLPPPRTAPAESGPLDLLYRSNFRVPSSHWGRADEPQLKAFRSGGYYNLTLHAGNCPAWVCTDHVVTDFRASVDVWFSQRNGGGAAGGLVYRTSSGLYAFLINTRGGSLSFWRIDYATGWKPLWVKKGHTGDPDDWTAWKYDCYVRKGTRMNSLSMERMGGQFRVGINGDWELAADGVAGETGKVGVFLTTQDGSYLAEARFKNFALYGIVPGTTLDDL